MIRALIADDEPLARRGLIGRLGRFGDVEIIGEAGDGQATLEAIAEFSPDVLFLDVDMPRLPGTELARALGPGHRPEIVFVSAYPEFAVDAFEVRALDYLVKPVTADRLACTIDRLRSQLAGGRGTRDVLTVRDGDRTTLLPAGDIDFVSAAGDYMVIHAGAERIVHRATLTALLNELASAGLVRIHRSTLVNAHRIRAVERGNSGDGEVILESGSRLRYSRSYRHELWRALDNPPDSA